MIDRRHQTRRAQEPITEPRVAGQFRPEQLQRDLSIKPQVLGQIHHRHAAPTQHALDPIATNLRADPRISLNWPGHDGTLRLWPATANRRKSCVTIAAPGSARIFSGSDRPGSPRGLRDEDFDQRHSVAVDPNGILLDVVQPATKLLAIVRIHAGRRYSARYHLVACDRWSLVRTWREPSVATRARRPDPSTRRGTGVLRHEVPRSVLGHGTFWPPEGGRKDFVTHLQNAVFRFS